MSNRRWYRRPLTWIAAVGVTAVLVAVVAPYVYINFVQGNPPAPLAFAETVTAAASDAGTTAEASLDGSWTVTDGSEAGYRVDEVLFGQDTEAVGRTTDVTGELEVSGTTINAASFTVDLTTVESDEGNRDKQFRDRIMETDTYPTATFVLTEPVTLDAIPADLEETTVTVTGDLTVHGATQSVTFDVLARRNGTTIEVDGTIAVDFADYNIPDASFGPATVQDHGEIEFLLTFEPTA
ncbi:MAG: YceI family protein [Acidimicrobiia bacterium]